MAKSHTPYLSYVRKGTSVPCYCRRIPGDIFESLKNTLLVIPSASGPFSVKITANTQALRFSIRTRNATEARKREREITLFLDQLFTRLRSQPTVDLTHKQVQALAGEFYAAWACEPDKFPDRLLYLPEENLPSAIPEDFDAEATRLHELSAALRRYQAPVNDESRLTAFGPIADAMLLLHGIPRTTELSRRHLTRAFAKVLPDAISTRARFAEGDYRPDETLSRFPPWEGPELPEGLTPDQPVKRYGTVSLNGLVEAWWKEASALGISNGTYGHYERTFRLLSGFLGHDDARMVSAQDILRFKDHRLTHPARGSKLPTPASFKSHDLRAMRSIFRWAVDNMLLTHNPTERVKIKTARPVKHREKDFTGQEAAALLRQALTQEEPLFRWTPWICAYTGCRVGEAMQLRKEDIRKAESSNTWVMIVTPEAGTVKNKQAREIPLHQHLVDLGFIDFVTKAKSGYLFLNVPAGQTAMSVMRSQRNRVARVARQAVPDTHVAPNHGWRHTFKSKGFEAGIQEKVLDAICGHAPISVGRAYGSVTLKTKVEAMQTFPRYSIE